MRPILLVPGYMNAGSGHWMSLWEASMPHAERVAMPNWEHPHRLAWVEALDAAIRKVNDEKGAPILVAHDLGCLALIHWAESRYRPVHAALLVAPPDAGRTGLPAAYQEFAPVPLFGLAFPSRVVASASDPYLTLDRARTFAGAWRSSITELGPRGRISAKDGFGPWARGEALLQELQ